MDSTQLIVITSLNTCFLVIYTDEKNPFQILVCCGLLVEHGKCDTWWYQENIPYSRSGQEMALYSTQQIVITSLTTCLQ